MLLWKTVDIADDQRAFLYRRGQLDCVLTTGRHYINAMAGAINVEIHDITHVIFEHKKSRFLMNMYGDKLSEFLERVELSDTHVGLMYRDGRLVEVLAPGSTCIYWKNIENITIDVIDISDSYTVNDKILTLLGHGLNIGKSKEIFRAISYNEIPDEHAGLLIVNGKLERILKSGNYGFWKYNRSVVIKLLDMRLQTSEVNGQEILTKDRVSLRVNLSANYRVTDVEAVAIKLSDFSSFIYRELQLTLREAIGTKTLDQLLEDKDNLNIVIADGVRNTFNEYGIELLSAGIKDIILPGDMKVIFNQVVEAQKEAEANLIKRREETQAMRSLHNTAKVMENNPILLRLKELESLERISHRIDKISVYGGLDGVLNDLVKIPSSM